MVKISSTSIITCKYCSLAKDETHFYTTNKARCKKCYLFYAKEWKANNYERQRSYSHKAEKKWISKPENKAINKLAGKRWHEEHSETRKIQARNNWLLRNYGLSEESYKRLYAKQSGKCAICTEWHDKLCVDHDHTTGQIRQLLCRRCNAAIGSFEEDVRLLTQAIDYIIKWRGTAQPPMPVTSDTADTYGHLDFMSL